MYFSEFDSLKIGGESGMFPYSGDSHRIFGNLDDPIELVDSRSYQFPTDFECFLIVPHDVIMFVVPAFYPDFSPQEETIGFNLVGRKVVQKQIVKIIELPIGQLLPRYGQCNRYFPIHIKKN